MEKVKVVVRCRPESDEEVNKRYGVAVRFDDAYQIGITDHTFRFDKVYDMNCKQNELYDDNVQNIIDGALTGYNGTVFAYGQTGSGKTHTMSGTLAQPGVIPRSFAHIFARIQADNEERSFAVRVSFVEIYMEGIRDLLSPLSGTAQNSNLQLRESLEHGVYVEGLSFFICRREEDMHHRLNQGNAKRTTASTAMNLTSSRSHAIFSVYLEATQQVKGNSEVTRSTRGKLHLVDLAGSERQSKSEAQGLTLKEAAKINLSLLTLGSVISALASTPRPNHIPYRDSKLTRLLEDSLGGNAKTVMIATVGPSNYNIDETVQTLRYANRVKSIVNKPTVNADVKDRLINELQRELDQVRAQAVLPPDLEQLPLVKMLRSDLSKMKALLKSAERAAIEAEIKSEKLEREKLELQKQFEALAAENRSYESEVLNSVEQLKVLETATGVAVNISGAGGKTTSRAAATSTTGVGTSGPTTTETGTTGPPSKMNTDAATGTAQQGGSPLDQSQSNLNPNQFALVPYDEEKANRITREKELMQKDADALREENEELMKALATVVTDQEELMDLRDKEQYLLRQEAELIVDKHDLLQLKDNLAHSEKMNAELLVKQEELLELVERLSKREEIAEESWRAVSELRARDTHEQLSQQNRATNQHYLATASQFGANNYNMNTAAPPGGADELYRYPETATGGNQYRSFQSPGVDLNTGGVNSFSLTPNTQQQVSFRHADTMLRATENNNFDNSGAAGGGGGQSSAAQAQYGGQQEQNSNLFPQPSSTTASNSTGQVQVNLDILELVPTSSVYPIPLPEALRCAELLSAIALQQHQYAVDQQQSATRAFGGTSSASLSAKEIAKTAQETLRDAEKLEFKLRGSTNLVGRAAAVIGWRKKPVDQKSGDVPKETMLQLIQVLDRVLKMRIQFLFDTDLNSSNQPAGYQNPIIVNDRQTCKKVFSCAEILGVTVKRSGSFSAGGSGPQSTTFPKDNHRFSEERGQPNVRPGGAIGSPSSASSSGVTSTTAATMLPQVHGATPR